MNNTRWTLLILYQLWFRDFQVVNINCKLMDLLAPNSFKIITMVVTITRIMMIILLIKLLVVLFNKIAIK